MKRKIEKVKVWKESNYTKFTNISFNINSKEKLVILVYNYIDDLVNYLNEILDYTNDKVLIDYYLDHEKKINFIKSCIFRKEIINKHNIKKISISDKSGGVLNERKYYV